MNERHLSSQCVVISDGNSRKALSLVRSFGKLGCHVVVINSTRTSLGSRSRYCSGIIKLPLLKSDYNLYQRELIAFSERWRGSKPILLPIEDDTVEWLTRNAEVMRQHYNFLVPNESALRISLEKHLTMEFAENLGIEVPTTLRFDSVELISQKLIEIYRENLQSQYLLKPCTSYGSLGLIFLNRSLDKTLDTISLYLKKFGPYLLQNRIDFHGASIGSSFLFVNGELKVGPFEHRRLHQFPLKIGSSTKRISVSPSAISTQSEILLSALNWNGFAMVEWKIDGNGSPKLLEINPRVWGSFELSNRCGLPFCLAYLAHCSDLDLSLLNFIREYPIGVDCSWFFPGEILRYLSTPRGERESLRSWLSGFPQNTEEWDVTDKRAFFGSILEMINLIWHKDNFKFLSRNSL